MRRFSVRCFSLLSLLLVSLSLLRSGFLGRFLFRRRFLGRDSGAFGCLGLEIVLILVRAQCTEHAMDEGKRLVVTQGLGLAQGLVDGHLVGDLVVAENLPSGDAQNIAVDHGHALDVPTLGMIGQRAVQGDQVLGHRAHDGDRVIRQRGLRPGVGDALSKKGQDVLSLLVGLVQRVQRPFTSCGTCHGSDPRSVLTSEV